MEKNRDSGGGGWALCRHLKSASAHKVDASMKDILIPL